MYNLQENRNYVHESNTAVAAAATAADDDDVCSL